MTPFEVGDYVIGTKANHRGDGSWKNQIFKVCHKGVGNILLEFIPNKGYFGNNSYIMTYDEFADWGFVIADQEFVDAVLEDSSLVSEQKSAPKQ